MIARYNLGSILSTGTALYPNAVSIPRSDDFRAATDTCASNPFSIAARYFPIRPQPITRIGHSRNATLSRSPSKRRAQSAVMAAFSNKYCASFSRSITGKRSAASSRFPPIKVTSGGISARSTSLVGTSNRIWVTLLSQDGTSRTPCCANSRAAKDTARPFPIG